MLFAIHCLDKPGAQQTRMANRADHLSYIKTVEEQMFAAGPLLDGDGEMIGSLLIIDFPDLASAQAFADADPYARAGLFQAVTVAAYKKVLP